MIDTRDLCHRTTPSLRYSGPGWRMVDRTGNYYPKEKDDVPEISLVVIGPVVKDPYLSIISTFL